MRRRHVVATALGLCAALAPAAGADAQQRDSTAVLDSAAMADSLPESMARVPLPLDVVMHLGHMTTSFSDTPSGMGLLATGMAEAAIASQYVALAGQDSTDLGALSRPMSAVIHAIDPSQESGGPGLGYGFKRAASAVAAHAALAAAVEGASSSVLFHLPFVERAGVDAAARADDAIALARQVQRASDAETAFRLTKRLADAVRAMAYGVDSDGDHRIGYAPGESGLAQALYHLELVYRVEGLDMPQVRQGR